MIRVLVVDDSLTVRKRLCEVLATDPELQVVGEAEDGKQAIDLVMRLQPDVITMDMMLPVMSGLAATEYIMAHRPTPILIVSSSTNRGELFKTYEALAAGAVDVLEKPKGSEPDGIWEKKLISTVRLVSRIRVITHVRGRLARHAVASPIFARPAGRTALKVVAIGASTGGPNAIVTLLHALPSTFRVPILFVLHIGEPFGSAFADWLDAQTPRRVRYAKDGDRIDQHWGEVLMAPPDRHLVVRGNELYLTRDPERHFCRPSVDVLFESVAREQGAASAACLLTGMGRDGAQGLLDIHRAGGVTFAQDEASCVVYGMPREAVILEAADRVLGLEDMAAALISLAEANP